VGVTDEKGVVVHDKRVESLFPHIDFDKLYELMDGNLAPYFGEPDLDEIEQSDWDGVIKDYLEWARGNPHMTGEIPT